MIEQIKERVKIEELVGESFTVTGKGNKRRSTTEHDSLVLFLDTNTWYWFSRGDGGDIFDWYQRQHNCSFRVALEELARRAGVELEPLTPEREAEIAHERAGQMILRMAAQHYHDCLLLHPAAGHAREYVYGRGWSRETIVREMLGYVVSDYEREGAALSSILRKAGLLDHPMAIAVLSIPRDSIVFTHRRGGQVVYLSARSIEGKRHFKIPEEFAGPQQIYVNSPARVEDAPKGVRVLVEGQADAISLGEMGVDAVALCGVDGELPKGVTHVAFDNDAPGRAKGLKAALAVGALCRVVVWPEFIGEITIKDANDFLRAQLEFEKSTGLSLSTELDAAGLAIVELARSVGAAAGGDEDALINQVLDLFDTLPEVTAAKLRGDVAREMGLGVADFNAMRKARKKERDREKKEGGRTIYTAYSAGMARGAHVFEQCLIRKGDGTSTVCYAVRLPGGEIKMQQTVDVGDTTYVPFPANTNVIDKEVVLFPEKPEPYGSQKELAGRVQAFIHTYLDVDPFYERLASYYVLFSWCYDLFDTLPYLRALGDYGTGKTRFLQTIGALCYRPMMVSGASTTSPIFRLIDLFRGTLIVDEADFSNSDSDSDIIKIFNVGYYSKGVVMRSDKDMNSDSETWLPSVHQVFGPKLLATRKPFTDRATESRCLTRRMTTARPRSGIPYTLGKEFWDTALRLRNQLLQYRLEKHRPVEVNQRLADESIEPRLNQVTMALKTIIDDDEMRGEIDQFMRAYNHQMIQERGMSLEAMVLQALVDIRYGPQGMYGPDYSMQAVAEKAQQYILLLDSEEKISARKVGQIVRDSFNLSTDEVKGGTMRGRHMVVFDDAELVNLMARYGVKGPDDTTGDTK